MSTDIPATLSADDVSSWSDDVDVVVIGFGIGGGCAAVTAAAAGARVLVLERAAAAGGTTSLAGGHFYLGGGTAVQQATGHPDSAEEMYKYLVAVSREPDHEKIRAYSDGSVEHFNWLEDLGFQFERSFYPGKVVVPPGTEGLSYTGNEKVWPFREQAIPSPRGHSVPVPGELGGASMVIDLLVKRADELGVQIRYETGATNLVLDADGAVTGVAWKHFTETGAVKAKSVIIAAGGFAYLFVDDLDLDEVVGLAAEDVAQSREGVHGHPLRRLRDQAEDLLAGEGDAPFGEQRYQVGGLEHLPVGHELAQVPAVAHLLDHFGSSQMPGWPAVSAGRWSGVAGVAMSGGPSRTTGGGPRSLVRARRERVRWGQACTSLSVRRGCASETNRI